MVCSEEKNATQNGKRRERRKQSKFEHCCRPESQSMPLSWSCACADTDATTRRVKGQPSKMAAATFPLLGQELRGGARALGIMHTGWDCDVKDCRKFWIVGEWIELKEVSENFVIDLIAEQTWVKWRAIVCDGGGGLLILKVYINLNQTTKPGTCSYCGLQSDSSIQRGVVHPWILELCQILLPDNVDYTFFLSTSEHSWEVKYQGRKESLIGFIKVKYY